MTTTAVSRRRGRGLHPRRDPVQQFTGVKSRTLPEYLEANEVNAVLAAAPNPRAKLLILLQWRAGLRVSEALALEPGDLSLDADRPTLRVRSGKGGKARVVPVHPELQTALIAVLNYADVGRGRIVNASRSTAWRWGQSAAFRAEVYGTLPPCRRIGTHTFLSKSRGNVRLPVQHKCHSVRLGWYQMKTSRKLLVIVASGVSRPPGISWLCPCGFPFPAH